MRSERESESEGLTMQTAVVAAVHISRHCWRDGLVPIMTPPRIWKPMNSWEKPGGAVTGRRGKEGGKERTNELNMTTENVS